MSLRNYLIALVATCAMLVATSYLLRPWTAVATPTIGPAMAIENIAPGQTTATWAISLDADTNADFLEYVQGDADNAAGDPDLWPIPHGSRLTIKLRDATEVTCCFVGNPDQTITNVVGAQAANTTKFEVDNGNSGACISLIGAGDSWSEVISYNVLVQQGRMPAGVCATETGNNHNTGYDVYGVCAVDADCDGDRKSTRSNSSHGYIS